MVFNGYILGMYQVHLLILVVEIKVGILPHTSNVKLVIMQELQVIATRLDLVVVVVVARVVTAAESHPTSAPVQVVLLALLDAIPHLQQLHNL